MAFNLPKSPIENQSASLFNKEYNYTSSVSAWELERSTASRFDQLLDVDTTGLTVGKGIQWSGAEWSIANRPPASLLVPAIASSSLESNYSASILTVEKSDGTNSVFTLKPSINFGPDAAVDTVSTPFFTGSDEITIVSASYTNNSDHAISALSASYYADDLWVRDWNLNVVTDQLVLTMSDNTFISASFEKVSTIDSVNGRFPDSVGNINITLIKTLTGPDATKPSTSGDGDSFIVTDDPDPNKNGITYVYDAALASWQNITPTSFDTDDTIFLRKSGGSMKGRLFLNNGEDPNEIATKDLVFGYTSSLNNPSGLLGFSTYLSADQDIASGRANNNSGFRRVLFDSYAFNDTPGNVINGRYVVPADVTQMIFDAGFVATAAVSSGHRLLIVRNGSEILAANAGWGVGGEVAARQVHSGLIKVTPGDQIEVQIRTWNNMTLASGDNSGTFLRGYIAQPPEPIGVQNIIVGSGLEGGGLDAPVSLSLSPNVARTGSNIFRGRVDITGSLDVTGDIKLRALQVDETGSVAGSTLFKSTVIASGLNEYINDTHASASGVPVNGLYRNGNRVMVRTA